MCNVSINILILVHCIDFLGCQEFPLSEYNLEALIRSPYDWRVVVIESDCLDNNRAFYLCTFYEKNHLPSNLCYKCDVNC